MDGLRILDKVSRAQISKSKTGGIDFKSDKIDNVFAVKRDSSALFQNDVHFDIGPIMLQQLQKAPGFVPVIISVEPLKDLRGFLEVSSVNPTVLRTP